MWESLAVWVCLNGSELALRQTVCMNTFLIVAAVILGMKENVELILCLYETDRNITSIYQLSHTLVDNYRLNE